MGRFNLSLSLLSVILVSVLWKPVYSDDKCTLACKGTPSTASFLTGHKYNYAVEGSVSIFANEADKQERSVKLIGQVAVSAVGNCVHVLKVQNLVISGPGGKKYGKPPGLEKPVQFTLQDGRVGPEICAEKDDTRRSLNIKRAIISLLQSGQKSGNEIDIFGACPTFSSSSQEGSSVLVHRSRDLSRCGYREHGKNDLISAVYNPDAEIKNTQVLQSSLNVESKLNNGVPEKVSAIEEHVYMPFSVGQNGAKSKVHTKLTLTGNAAGADNGACTESRSIIFENTHGIKSEQSNLQAASEAVKETAKTLQKEAGSKSAGNFAQVVRIFRTVNKEDLNKLYSQVKGNNLERRVFLDALLRAGTGYSIEVSVQLLKKKELGPIEQRLVFLSLGNARHVNDDAIKAAATLLDIPDIPKEVYLGVGALASTYCHTYNCHNAHAAGIVALSQKLASKLNCKPKSKVDEDVTVAVLKGIRNIRHLEDNVIDKLSHCISDQSVKARVKVAALEAIHADPCAQKLHKLAMDVMKNRQLDSEIRIKAYLAVIECPCSHSATEIKNLLDSEPVHQVGRFITSSLRHIRDSTNPDKELARRHYGLMSIPIRFKVDDRKFSFYREASYNVAALGVGGTVEQTVIYSQDSFLPRSAALNLTAEIFGHNVNVLEIGGRQGNLDRVVEHFLGPKGYFRTKKLQDIYDDLKARSEAIEKKVEGKVRGRRSVNTDIDNFDKHIKAESTPYDNELDMDLYLKMFGTDAVFLSLGDDKGFDSNAVLDQILKYLETGMNKAKRFQQEIRTHLLFLDAELAYATSTGLPLKLNLIGSATGRFEVATNVDIRQILKDPNNAKIDIKLVPSTDIEISGQLVVDADSVVTGLKLVTNLHSSTGGHLRAKTIENGEGIDIQFGLPLEKQEIISATNELVFMTTEKGQKETRVPVKTDGTLKDFSGCFDQLSDVLGLTLCTELVANIGNEPAGEAAVQHYLLKYPLTGLNKFKLQLEKNDLKGYHVKAVLRKNPAKRAIELVLEAEGASKKRRTAILGEVVITDTENSVLLSLESPIKSYLGQVSFLTKPNEYSALVKARVDKEEYYGKVGFSASGTDARRVYKPIVEYNLPDNKGNQNMKIDGEIIKEVKGPSTKYTLQGIKINMPNNEVATVNGNFVNTEGKGFEGEIKAKKGDQSLVFLAALKEHKLKMELKNTLNPNFNFKLDALSHIEKGNINNEIDLHYGPDFNVKENRAILSQLYKQKGDTDNFSLITKNKIHIFAVPFLVKFDVIADNKKLNVKADGQCANDKANFELDGRIDVKQPKDYIIKVEAKVNENGFGAFSKRDIVDDTKSNFENYITITGAGKYELSGVVLHKTEPNDLNIGAIGHFKVSGGKNNQDVKFDIGAIENANSYSSHVKVGDSKGEMVDFLLKITRGANPSGTLKMTLKDTIAANGQYKVTDSDGKGNGMIIVDFKTAQRKIKGDVKFLAKNPVFNADIVLFLDFEKNNNDKIVLKTENKNNEKLVESKNKLEYAGKKFELNLHQDGEFDLDGKLSASVEVVLPTERVLAVKINRDFTTKGDDHAGHGEVVLTDLPKRGAQGSTISYKGKVLKGNVEKDTVDYEGQLEIKLKDGRNLDNSFRLTLLPSAKDQLKFDFKTEVKGSLIPKPASLVVSSHFTDLEKSLVNSDETYRVKATYGNDIGFELSGASESAVTDKETKYVENTNLNVLLPFKEAHDIKIASKIFFLVPTASDDDIFEYTVSQSLQLNNDAYKIDANGKFGTKIGDSKIKVIVPHQDPFSLDTSYKADLEGDNKMGGVEVKTTYGKGKTATIVIEAAAKGNENILNVRASSPQAEKLKKLEIRVVTKNPSPESFTTTVSVDADGRVYNSDVAVIYSKAHPVIDLKYTSPSTQKTSRIYAQGEGLSSNQGKLHVIVDNIKDFSFDGVSEAHFQKDNINFKTVITSEKLGYKNYKVEITSKDSGSGKRLEINAVNDGKEYFSGSTSYINKQEGPKTIIEGSGSVKIGNDQKSANFKYIRTVLTEGPEQGIETFTNVAIGERSYVAESKVTNMEYKTSYVYCEEKKQCAHAELNAKLNTQKPGQIQHTVSASVDLRKLGLAPEFGLQASSELFQNKPPQYLLDLHVKKDENKYHLHAYSQPDIGKIPAGITITLPKRVLALESSINYPTDKALPFPIKGEVVLHMDKNKPQLKTAARFMFDLDQGESKNSIKGEVGFAHPKLGKEAVAKFGATLQFNSQTKDSFKIESNTILSHPSIGANREMKVLVEASPVRVKVFVSTPLVKIIDMEGSVTLQDKVQESHAKFSLLEGKPVQVTAICKEFQYFEFNTGYSDEAERKLSVIAHIDPEKRVDISADIILQNEKKNIIRGALFIQDNLVKSDYGISKDNFNYFVKALSNDLSTLEGRVKQLGDKGSNEFKAIMSKVQPTIKQMSQYEEQELQKLLQELTNDQTLKEISEQLHVIVKYFANILDTIVQAFRPTIERIQKTLIEFSKKATELYETQIEVQIKQLYANIAAVIKEVFDGLLDVVAHAAALVSDFFEKHKAELTELTNTIAEIFKDLTRIVVAELKDARVAVGQLLTDLAAQIKDMPFVQMLNEKIQEFHVPDRFFFILTEGYQNVRPFLPTEELRNFADALVTYSEKKLKNEKFDEKAELRKIYEKYAIALTSVVNMVRQQLTSIGITPSIFRYDVLPLLTNPGQSMPSFSNTPVFSVFNMIMRGELPDPIAILSAYRPRYINPLDEIPSKLRAVVVNGQHIFTFDGRHMTFPGSCRYVLVHDFADRNMTLVMQLQNGKAKALLLEDKSGTTVELRENGQVAVNGAVRGFPVDEKDIYAYRMANGRLGVGTSYGLKAVCSPTLSVCYIEASGYYLGKFRGLLGDGNNEPYDDFRLPNGKIAASEAEFGNAYRLSGSCGAVKTPEHSAHQHHAQLPPACEEVFGSPTLKPFGLLLDVSPFRQACIHAAPGKGEEALKQACDLARGYVALANTGMLPAIMPRVCVPCEDFYGSQPSLVGDTYDFNLPAKKADLIIAIETTKANEPTYKNLVVPMVGQIVDGLKAKKLDDIKVYLYGVTSKMRYPILYDTDIKLKNAKIKFDDESRQAPCDKTALTTGVDKIDHAIRVLNEVAQEIKTVLGLTNVQLAYNDLFDLPIRPDAYKHITFVMSETSEDDLLITRLIQTAVYGVYMDNNAITNSLITVTDGLEIGQGKKASDIIGFTEDSVLILGEKKPITDPAVVSSLDVDDDDTTKFVLNTNGVVFSAQNFKAMNPGQQKQFIRAASSKVLELMTSKALDQSCVCVYADPLRTRTVCINEDESAVPAARRRK